MTGITPAGHSRDMVLDPAISGARRPAWRKCWTVTRRFASLHEDDRRDDTTIITISRSERNRPICPVRSWSNVVMMPQEPYHDAGEVMSDIRCRRHAR